MLLADPALEGSDVSVTAAAIAAALRKIEFDLLIVGGLTDDGSTGAVPGALAEHLGLPCITNARKVEIADGGLKSSAKPMSAINRSRTAPVALDDGTDVWGAAIRLA